MRRSDRRIICLGWGTTESEERSDELLMAYVPFMNNTECARRFSGTDIIIHPTYLCAGGFNRTDSCPGDSGKALKISNQLLKDVCKLLGGPIQTFGSINGYDRMVQYGIVASGVGCLKTKAVYPSVYTNIAYYLEWILDNMEEPGNGGDNDERSMEDSRERTMGDNFYFRT